MALNRIAALCVAGTACLGPALAQTSTRSAPDRSTAQQTVATKPKTVRAEYASRAARIAPDDANARVALAEWCRTNGLLTEMKREATRVIKRDADNEKARIMLGQVRRGQRWVVDPAAMRQRGFVRYGGAWVRKYDAERLKYVREMKRKRRELERTLNGHLRDLWSRSERKRGAALAALTEIADRREWPALDKLAREQHTLAVRYYRELAVVHATVRAQRTEVLGLTPFTTSLGVGTPVTLQLPQTRSTSVGGTVAIPVGRD